MNLGARVYYVVRVDIGPDAAPQVRVKSGTLVSRHEDVAALIVGTPCNPHPSEGAVTILRGVTMFADKAEADAQAFGTANRLIVNFKFKAVDVFYSDGQTHQLYAKGS